MGNHRTLSKFKESRRSYIKRIRKEFIKGQLEIREFFRQCDAERERRYNAGDKRVYEEL